MQSIWFKRFGSSAASGNMHSRFKGSMARIALLMLSSIAVQPALATIETDPGDYIAAPPGVNLGILYYQHAERKSVYANGNRVPGNFRLDTDIGVARYVHYTKVGDYVLAPQVIVPFGSVRLKSPLNLSASGVADPFVGGTLWLLNDAANLHMFGLTALVALPIGNYDAARGALNLGENRWKTVLQAGYVRSLSDNLALHLVGEATIYGNNDNFAGANRKQDNGYEFQSHLSYKLSPTAQLGLSYIHTVGGESRLNNVAQNDRANNNRFKLTYSQFIQPTVQFLVQYGQDIKVENGFKEKARLNFRVVKIF